MKPIPTFLFIAALSFSNLSADTNTTKIKHLKKDINYEEKLKESLQVLKIDLKNSATDNNMTIAFDNNKVGYYYNKMSKTEIASKYYAKAVKIAENQTKPYSKQKTVYFNNLATAYEKLNKLSDALKYYEKALKIYKDKLPEGHPYIASNLYDIGNIYEKMQKKDKAIEYHLQALKIRKKSLRPLDHPDTIASYDKILKLYTDAKNYDMVLKYGNELLELVNADTKTILEKKLNKIKELNKNK